MVSTFKWTGIFNMDIKNIALSITFSLLFLVGCGGSGGEDNPPQSTPEAPTNTPVANTSPTLSLSPEVEVNELTEVIINAEATDSDGTITSIKWEQVAGEPVSLNDTDKLVLSFTSPKVLAYEVEKSFTFKLVVTDDQAASAEAEVNVKVIPTNNVPVAEAGDNKTFLENELVSLSCDESYDPDGSAISYNWEQVEGPEVKVLSADTCNPSFKLPLGSSLLSFKLTVEDEDKTTSSDLVSIVGKEYSGTINSFNKESLIFRDEYSSDSTYSFSASVEKGIAFTSDNSRLKALDISDPYNIRAFGWESAQNGYQASVIFDDLLIAEGRTGLWFYDISDISNINLVSSIENAFQNKKFARYKNIVYVSSSEFGIEAIDISNLASPRYIDSNTLNESLSGVNDLKIKGDFLYVATESEGLKVFNVSTPLESILVAELQCDCSFKQIEINENIAALTGSKQSLLLVDISLPTQLSVISETSVSSQNIAMAIAKNVIAVGDSSESVRFLDISDPNFPKWVGKLPNTIASKWLTFHEDTLLLVDYFSSSLESFDISSLSAPLTKEYQVDQNFQLNSLVVEDEVLYLSSKDNRLIIKDASNYEQPEALSEVTVSKANKLLISEDLLFVGTQSEGLHILNVSDKRAPFSVGNIPSANPVNALAVKGDKLLINTANSNLVLYDISEPSEPVDKSVLHGLASRGGAISDISTSGNTVHVAAENEAAIININENNELNRQGYFFKDWFGDDSWHYVSIVSYKDYVYLLSKYYGLRILNISEPENIIEEARLLNISGTSLKLIGNELYVVDPETGISKYSIKAPSSPKLLSSYITSDYVTDIAIQGDKIFNMEWSRDPTAYYYNYSLPKNGYSVFDFDKLLNVTGGKARATAGSNLTYDVTWDFDGKIKLDCIVSGGECEVALDTQNNSAKVLWNTPISKGEYQISILIGNTSFFNSYEDMLILD